MSCFPHIVPDDLVSALEIAERLNQHTMRRRYSHINTAPGGNWPDALRLSAWYVEREKLKQQHWAAAGITSQADADARRRDRLEKLGDEFGVLPPPGTRDIEHGRRGDV